MLSLSCKAAIKAVVYLGSTCDSGSKAGIRDIAAYINENEHTVGKILQRLVKQKIINSSKGPKGGFFISRSQVHRRVIDIVEAIDGDGVFAKCGLGLSKCNEKRPCPFHDEFKPVRELFKKMCREKKISDLYENVNSGLAYLSG